MATATKAMIKRLGPLDRGLPMTFNEFMRADYEEGYQYELIDGELYVFPTPSLPENRVETWIGLKLQHYYLEHPEVINYVTSKARVIVSDRPRATVPEPDQAAYHNFPLDQPFKKVRWQNSVSRFPSRSPLEKNPLARGESDSGGGGGFQGRPLQGSGSQRQIVFAGADDPRILADRSAQEPGAADLSRLSSPGEEMADRAAGVWRGLHHQIIARFRTNH